MKNLISREAAATRANVTPQTIDRWRDKGLLTTYKRGRAVRIDQEELDRICQFTPTNH